jgi:hypothetical protein
MPSREELYKLVDSLPEGAIEAANRTLSHLQVWPPAPPPDVQEMRQRMRQRLEERRLGAIERQRPGTIGGFGGSSNYDPDRGSASSSFSHWDDDTFVTETLRRHKSYEFTVIERVRVDGTHLIYKHEITGPGAKRDEREIAFEISAK